MESPMQSFYREKNVLVTGLTGFLGKAVVEKLLRSCPGVGTIYVLLRPKGSSGVKERLEGVLANAIFNTIRVQEPSLLRKLVPIPGDISLPFLGLSPEDRVRLTSNLHVIFHCAATVKFEEALGRALKTNVLGTQRLLQLSKEASNLISFVHVSTAFANCELKEIEERVYTLPNRKEHSSLLQRLETDPEDDFSDIDLRALLGSKPNTYIFSKAWAEEIILQEQEVSGIPVAIVRPSGVSAALREPLPGWVDNLLGPAAILAVVAAGKLHSVVMHGEKKVDLIPIDLLVNLIISVGWDVGSRKEGAGVPVYNCCTGSTSPLWNDEATKLLVKWMREFPVTEDPWIWIVLWKSEWGHWLLDLLIHKLPSQLLDLLALMRGEKPKCMKLYQRMSAGMLALRPFHTNEWEYEAGNMDSLRERMGPNDRLTFNFETRGIDWDSYLLHYHLGLGRFVFGKEF